MLKASSPCNITIEMFSGYTFKFDKNVQAIRKLNELYSPDEISRLKAFKSNMNNGVF